MMTKIHMGMSSLIKVLHYCWKWWSCYVLFTRSCSGGTPKPPNLHSTATSIPMSKEHDDRICNTWLSDNLAVFFLWSLAHSGAVSRHISWYCKLAASHAVENRSKWEMHILSIIFLAMTKYIKSCTELSHPGCRLLQFYALNHVLIIYMQE